MFQPVSQEQVQQAAQILLAVLSAESVSIPANLIDGVVSGKTLIRGLISGELVVCASVEGEGENPKPDTKEVSEKAAA